MTDKEQINALASALEELIEACEWVEKHYLPFEKLSISLSNANAEMSRYYASCNNRKPI